MLVAAPAFEFEIQIGLDVLGAFRQARQPVGPQIEPRQQVVAEPALHHRILQIAVGAGDQLEIAFDLLVAAYRREAFFLQRAQQQRLFVQAEFADLVEEQQTLMRRTQEAGAVAACAGVRALDVPEQRAHRAVAAQRGAVHFDEPSGQLMLEFLQLEHALGELTLAGAGRPHQQHRCLGARGHGLDLLDHAVECGIARGDAALEQVAIFQPLLLEALRDQVVARQIQIDDREAADLAGRLFSRRRCLQQPAGEMPALGEQEPADLRHVRTGGDVDVVILIIRLERVAAQEIVERRVDALEIPGVGQEGVVAAQRGFGRDLREIVRHRLRKAGIAALVDQ